MMLNKVSAVVCLLSSFSLHAADSMTKAQIQERIKPIGAVHIQAEQEQTQAADNAVKPVIDVTPGKAIYTKYCVLCHGSGLAGAPKFGDATDWNVRLDARTIDELLSTAQKGLNAMPAKGSCNECSDEDLKAAITYMLPKS